MGPLVFIIATFLGLTSFSTLAKEIENLDLSKDNNITIFSDSQSNDINTGIFKAIGKVKINII